MLSGVKCALTSGARTELKSTEPGQLSCHLEGETQKLLFLNKHRRRFCLVSIARVIVCIAIAIANTPAVYYKAQGGRGPSQAKDA